MRKLITFSPVSFFLLLILLSFFCTDPVKPDFTEPPVIGNSGAVSTFGSLNRDSLFGLFITVSGTAPFTYQWHKNDSIISLSNNDTLLFSSLSLADSGSYFCIVANTASSDTSLAYTLVLVDTMPEPPVILDSGAVQAFGSLQVDSAFGMFIRATGTDPLEFTWYKNDTAIALVPDNDTLFFPALSFADSGSYYCKVSNAVGYDSSKTYNVVPLDTVPKPPFILDSGTVHTFGSRQIDSLFGMFVRVAGTEPITYAWYKNDTSITVASNDTLVFTALALNDSGYYYCIAQNTWGADTSKTYPISFGNFAPEWLHDTLHLHAYENGPFALNLSDSCSDLNNDVLGYFIKTQSAISGDSIIGSVYHVTPTYEDAGFYPFTFGAHDREDTAYCPVILTVIDVNRPPYFRVEDSLPADQYIVDEGDTLTVLFSVVDLDNDTVNTGLKSTTLPGGFTSVQIADTTIAWIAGANDSGLYTLTLFATDKKDSTFDTITIGVGYVNIPPRITMTGQSNGSAIQIKESTTFACSLHVSDVNTGDTVKFLPSANFPSGAQFIGVGSDKGLFTYTPGFSVSNATANTVFSNITFYAQDNGTPAAQDSFKINITVLDSSAPPVPVLQSPANNAVAQPVSLTLRWNTSIGAASYTLNVSTHSDFSDTILNQSTTDTAQAVSSLSNNTTYYWRVNASNAGGSSDWSDVWNFTVTNNNTAPTITSQPVSDTAVLGDSVRFSVTATGVPAPTYQWRKNGVLIPGATSPAFSIATVTASDSGNYTVVVKNIVDSVTSNTAVLYFNIVPTITTQPISQTKWANDSVTFAIAATGSGPLNFQWEKDGEIIDGATAESYMYTNIKYPDDSGAVFSCLVTNRFGSVAASDNAVLKLNALKAVAAGANHSLFLKTDGTLWACGNNNNGQLGIDSISGSSLIPVYVMDDVQNISAGEFHSLILKNDGNLWACGANLFGQLGDGTTTNSKVPILVKTNVKKVSAGGYHSILLQTDGTVWTCGYNSSGQLGDNTTNDRSNWFQIMAGVENISAGFSHSLIQRSDGTLLACGGNNYGEFGNGTTFDRCSTAVQVRTGVKYISAGFFYSMILSTDGTLFSSGHNNKGQLGNDDTVDCSAFIQIRTDIQSISTGWQHSMILETNGSLWACGYNDKGQLGDETTFDRSTPVKIMDDVHSMDIYISTLIIKNDGTLWGCGENGGKLGDGTTTEHHTPIQIKF